MPRVCVFFIAIIFAGCATFSTKMNEISVGMKKSQVIQIMGNPVSTSAQGKREYLAYRLFEDMWSTVPSEYYVRLENGIVESYGKMGDFDSANVPEQKVTIDLNQKITTREIQILFKT